MRTRIITGLLIVAFVVPMIVFDQMYVVLQVLLSLIALIGIWEFTSVLNNKREKKIPLWIRIIAMISTLVIFYNIPNVLQELSINPNYLENVVGYNLNFAGLLIAVLITFCGIAIFSKSTTIKDIIEMLFAIFFVSFSAISIFVIRSFGFRYLFFMLLVVCLTDVFALVFGIKFGKHKMAPHLSPKKSWEGAIGGLVVGVLIASLFGCLYGVILSPDGILGGLNPEGYLTLFSPLSYIGQQDMWIQCITIVGLALLGSIFGQIGDFVASKIKRENDVKDFGKTLPGHGGILDRLDSVFFSAMIFASLYLMLGIF